MKNVFVPLDGSELAEQAVAPAIALAGRWGGRVHIASVVPDHEPVPILAPASGLVEHSSEAEEDQATEYLSSLAGRVSVPDGVELVSHVRRGAPAPALVSLMDEVGADLVFLTTHGRGAFERLWLGSVADQLLRKAGRPTVSIRPHEGLGDTFQDPAYPGTVLIALDGSPGAEEVLRPLRALLPSGAKRVILAATVEQPLPFSTPYLPDLPSSVDLVQQRKDLLANYLEGLSDDLRGEGVESVALEVVVDSGPAHAVLRMAEAEKPDLIALASHARGGASRVLMGSVADKVIRSSDVPVFTVPIADD